MRKLRKVHLDRDACKYIGDRHVFGRAIVFRTSARHNDRSDARMREMRKVYKFNDTGEYVGGRHV